MKKDDKILELGQSIKFLSEILHTFHKVYICIDALDECTDDHRWQLISSLQTLFTSDPNQLPVIKLFFTVRPQIKDYINSHPAIGMPRPSSMILEASEKDIAAYVIHKIAMDTKVTMDEDFKQEIVAEILATSQGMLVITFYLMQLL